MAVICSSSSNYCYKCAKGQLCVHINSPSDSELSSFHCRSLTAEKQKMGTNLVRIRMFPPENMIAISNEDKNEIWVTILSHFYQCNLV